MRYEKPVVINLGDRAVSGGPEACFSGDAVGSGVCALGNSGSTDTQDCLAGLGASGSNAACLSGGSAGQECGTGADPNIMGSCTSGPTYAAPSFM